MSTTTCPRWVVRPTSAQDGLDEGFSFLGGEIAGHLSPVGQVRPAASQELADGELEAAAALTKPRRVRSRRRALEDLEVAQLANAARLTIRDLTSIYCSAAGAGLEVEADGPHSDHQRAHLAGYAVAQTFAGPQPADSGLS